MMNCAVAIQKLGFSYAGMTALHGVSFDISVGHFFIIIGPNGSGKTTLLKLLCGILMPEKGSVEILGRRQKQYSRKELARTLALVPQLTASDFPFTVQELVLLGRTPHLGMLGLEGTTDLEIAAQAMAFAEVDHLSHRKLDQLSGGELQRVFIARAICQQPKIIVLDEPTASLDLAHQVRIMDLMERLKKEHNITVIMVTHDVNLAAMYADTLLVLNRGHVAELGKPIEVIKQTTIEKVYDCAIMIDTSPLGQFPRLTPVPGRLAAAEKSGRRP